MKRTLSALLMIMSLVTVLGACKKNSDDGGAPAPQAATPTPAPQACGVPGGVCTTNPFPNDPNIRFEEYRWGTQDPGFCGCRRGYRPVMNPQWGISCAPNWWMSNNLYGNGSYPNMMGFSFQATAEYYFPQNGQITSIPQITFSPAITDPFRRSCPPVAASVCDTRYANSCPAGGICRPTSGGSYVGLCYTQPGNESYSAPTPRRVCQYGYGFWYCRWSYESNSPGVGTDNRIPR